MLVVVLMMKSALLFVVMVAMSFLLKELLSLVRLYTYIRMC
jgi:hypothetical protein